ncbi:MAG TPA: glycoside hydrolase family 3 N-terminal domain-containing protein, partial [Alphaproteobacteria bacterium]|nr:glycoside hydrolase family 3 N-terminal domain-containing protein [Alphaproteobacteria bacterium]
PRRAATVSPSVVNDVIRSYIGFSGVLFSDDLSMQALGGDMRRRTHDALAAGCDVVLHCNGVRDEMRRVADGAGGLSERTLRGLADAEALRRRRAQPFGADARHAATARLDGLLATG